MAGGASQAQQKAGGGKYLWASDQRLYSGSAKASRVSRLRVVWPSGRVEEWQDVPAEQFLALREEESSGGAPQGP